MEGLLDGKPEQRGLDMARAMAGWCGQDRYVDAQGRVHVAVAEEEIEYACNRCSLKGNLVACRGAKCISDKREDGEDVHFELEAVAQSDSAEGFCACRKCSLRGRKSDCSEDNCPLVRVDVEALNRQAVRGPQGTEGGGE